MHKTLFASLPLKDQVRLKNSAAIAQSLEDLWAGKIAASLESLTPRVIESFRETGRPPKIDFEQLFIEHFFDVTIKSMRYAMTEAEEQITPPKKGQKLALPAPKVPKTLFDLMKLYDAWRKGRYKPKRAVAQAKEIKRAYLDKVKSVWQEHSEDFRKGDVGSQDLVVQGVQDAAKTTSSRAQTIVRTETTNFYNEARKQVYDESPYITHYLFVAIRDAATSPWCTPLTTNGQRGRSGLVYAKSDPLCDKERPACHPNCRSEYLPLNRMNPAHLRFIQDLSIQRRQHSCYPLLKGWRS